MSIQYQRNNIVFRIASANAISEFKGAQAASFIQIARKELEFDIAAKESILLEFDRFSQLVFRLEKLYLNSGEINFNSTLLTTTNEQFIEEINTIELVTERHSDVFTNNSKAFGKIIHGYARSIVIEKFKGSINARTEVAFVNVIATISDYLQHILLAFHEYNNNLITKTSAPFICTPNFCVARFTNAFVPESNRIKFYTDNNVENVFVLKNYSDLNLFRKAADHFEKLGITIVPEEVLTKEEPV